MSEAPETSAAPVSAPVDSGAAVSESASQAAPTTTQTASAAAVRVQGDFLHVRRGKKRQAHDGACTRCAVVVVGRDGP